MLTFRDSVPTPFYRRGPNLVCYSRPKVYTYTRQISSEFVHCVGFRWPKTTILGEILTFLGAPVPTAFYRRGPNVVCYSRRTVYAYVPNFVSIGVFCRPLAVKTPNFCVFWTSAFSGVANWLQSEKDEHGCTTINLPLSNGIKIVSVLQRLHSEIWRTISDVQKRDEQTDRQTDKKLNVLATPAAGEIRAPPNLAW